MSSKYKTKIKPLDDGLQLAGSAGNLAAQQLENIRSGLNAAQVKLRTNKKFKQIVVAVTFFAALVDFLGTVIVAPMLPALCFLAPNGPFHIDTVLGQGGMDWQCSTAATATGTCAAERQATYDAFMLTPAVTENVSPHAFKNLTMGVSTSVEMPMAIGQFAGGIGSFVFGNLIDKIGAKSCMLVCLTMGLVGYIMIYAAGIWVKSYWLFAGGIWINSFFGVVSDIASTYMAQLFADSPKERDLYVGLVTAVAILGATIGALVVAPFAAGNGANAFLAVWIAIGLTVLAIVLVLFVIVTPPPANAAEKKEPIKTPKAAQRMLITTCVASAFDSAGDVGTAMARSTILMSLFVAWGTPAMQNMLLLILIGVAICTFILLASLKKVGFSLAGIATVGAFATLVVQLLLASVAWGEGAYIALWHAGKLFGMLSTFGSGMMIAQIAPAESVGFYNGLNAALTNFASGASQLIFSRVYDTFNTGTPEGKRGQVMLYVTSGISFAAFLVYGGLIPVWPKEKDEKAEKKKAEDFENFDMWSGLSDAEWSRLPMETIDAVNFKMVEHGKAPRVVSWGDYAQERAELTGLKDRALKDFTYITGSMRDMLADREKMIAMQQMQSKTHDIMPKVDRDKAKAEMGAWIADYFDDAGYQDWEKMAPIYKSMLMNAFPPVDDLDDLKPDYAKMPVDQFEEALMKFLAVMDEHLATERKRSWSKLSNRFFAGLVQRR